MTNEKTASRAVTWCSMDARNPPRYVRGIIITKVLIRFLSITFGSIQVRVDQARCSIRSTRWVVGFTTWSGRAGEFVPTSRAVVGAALSERQTSFGRNGGRLQLDDVSLCAVLDDEPLCVTQTFEETPKLSILIFESECFQGVNSSKTNASYMYSLL
jgi:hypothetical protein